MGGAIRSLEFPQVVSRISNLAETDLGKEAVCRLEPGRSMAELNEDFDAIEEMIGLTNRFPAIFIPDINLNRQIYSPEEIFSLLRFLRLTEEIKILPVRKEDVLDCFISRLNQLPGLKSELERVFDDSGSIRDDASTDLARIRKEVKKTHDRLMAGLGRIIKRKNRILNNEQIMTRSGRYVLCVRQEQQREMKGVVHDISDSGHSVFIEPEATIDDQNHLEELRIKERREIERIVRSLSLSILGLRGQIEVNINIVVRLDTILARTRYAQEINGIRPDLNDGGEILIKSGRHPILYDLKGGEIVPLNLGFDSGILVVTGPNAGGKTVLLKTVGLLTLMANSGIFVPAEYGTRLPVVDEIFAKIGDDQSIRDNRSSFGAQIEIVKRIMDDATADSLILLDELGSNTSPAEGSALACSILEAILKIGSRCVITTHSEELKTFAYKREGFRIGAMGYNGRPTYTFQPDYFAPSCAFRVAEKMGLSSSVLNRAKELVDAEKGRFEELTARLASEINEAEQTKQELTAELERLSGTRQQYEIRLNEIETWKRRQRQEYNRQLKKILSEARSEVEHLIEKLSTAGPKKGLIKDVKARIEALRPREDVGEVLDLSIGTMVKAGSEQGRIVARKKDNYLVELGRIRCWMHGSQLQVITSPRSEPIPELHLRGKQRDEVAYLVDQFIGDAISKGVRTIKIIHGKGKGIVKQEVDSFLRRDKRVEDFRIDPDNLGQIIVRLHG